ncbi:MAG: GFA family protein [Woeseiaceae bacterium]|nr:GFA family protein [Woeseiaceae bacterium]
MQELVEINGGCHCGNIRFVLCWPESESEIGVRKCGCTFCQKHAGAWISHRSSELAIDLAEQSLVSKYGFGTKTADFYVCSVCGVTPFVVSEIDGRNYAVVNANALEDVGKFQLSSSSTDFDGEDTGSRLARRQRNWIPKVLINGPAT